MTGIFLQLWERQTIIFQFLKKNAAARERRAQIHRTFNILKNMSSGGKTSLFKNILNYLAWQFQDVTLLSPIPVIYFLLSSNGKMENFILTCSPLLELT